MHLRTLVLDREYTPHRTVSWHRGLSLVFSDKAEVIEEYEECVQTVYVSFPVPAVVAGVIALYKLVFAGGPE